MAEILKTINGQIVTDIGSTKVTTTDGLIVRNLRTKDKVVVVAPSVPTISNVMGVALASISNVMGVASANISNVIGVNKE